MATSSPTASTGSAHRQYLVLGLLFSAGMVNFLDRGSLSIANGPIRAGLHLSATQMGGLLSLFSFAYGLAQLPIGALLDRFRARVLMGVGLLVWSAAQAATALVASYGQFVPLRLLLGIGEAPFFPAGMQAVQGWFAPEKRGLPTGVLNASSMLGQAIAPPVLTVLMLRFGWRAMFACIGSLGILLALAWFPLYRDPAPRAPNPDATPSAFGWQRWLALLRSRTMWGMLLGFSGINYTAWLYLAWLPGYLEQARHVSIARSGLLSSLPFLLGACGMFASGWVADALTRSGRGAMGSRKVLILIGMTLSAGFTFLVPSAQTTQAAVWLIGAALFCVHFAGTAAWGVVQFAAPAGHVATVASLQNFGSFMVASIAPLLTGWLLDRTHSFHLALLVCSAITLAGALAYWLLVRGPIQLPAAVRKTISLG